MISTEILPEDAASALLREARRAAVQVIGGQRRGPIGEFLRSGSAPFWRPAPPARSWSCETAVRFAFREAAVRGCELEAVRVWRRRCQWAQLL
jgi:hypothetical protein